MLVVIFKFVLKLFIRESICLVIVFIIDFVKIYGLVLILGMMIGLIIGGVDLF